MLVNLEIELTDAVGNKWALRALDQVGLEALKTLMIQWERMGFTHIYLNGFLKTEVGQDWKRTIKDCKI